MVYVVYVTSKKEQILERFNDSTWEYLKNRYPEILYVTKEIDDPELKKYECKSIIWERFVSPISKAKERISVKYVPENVLEMEKEASLKLQKKQETVDAWNKKIKELKDEKYIRNLPKKLESQRQHAAELSENDKYFEEEMTEYEIMCKWKELNFIMPPPSKVLAIKKEYKKTWEEFKEIINQLCQ